MMTTTNPVVTFGSLDLYGENDLNGIVFDLEMIGSDGGLDWGRPEAVDVWVKSLLMDGSLVATQRHENRQVEMQVRIVADSADGLQSGEEALFLECSRPTTFTWTPPDETAATTVFIVLTSHLSPVVEDDLDERRLTRTYQLSLTCEPFTRSVDAITETVTPLGVVPAAAVLIDECTVSTGWTGSDTVSVVSGQAVRVTHYSGYVSTAELWLQRAGTVVVTEAFIRVKMSTTIGNVTSTTLSLDGTEYAPYAVSAGFTWFAVPAGTYSTMKIRVYGGRPPPYPGTGFEYLTIWSMYQTNVATIGTRRELTHVVDVEGSARTPATVVVSHASNNLGNIVVYTYPRALGPYGPSLAGFRTGGGAVTLDATLVSGGREPLSATPTYTVPQENLPQGTYEIVALIRHTAAGKISLTWTATVAGVTSTGTVKVTIAAANTWQVTAIDWVDLPPLALKSTSDKSIVLTLLGPADSEVDIPWLFHTDGSYTVVADAAEKTLTIVAPEADQQGGMVYVGDHHPGAALKPWGRHQFIPTQIGLYLVTSGTEDAGVTLTYYPRWFTHARL